MPENKMLQILQRRHHQTIQLVAFIISLPLQFIVGLKLAQLFLGVVQ